MFRALIVKRAQWPYKKHILLADYVRLLQVPLPFIHVVYLMCPVRLLSVHADKHKLLQIIIISNMKLVYEKHL